MGPRRKLLQSKRVLKNTAGEAEQFRIRAAIAFACVLAGVLGLGFWYFRLQVWQHDDYAMRSEANRVKLRPVVPGRGLIYDRQGRILADNVPAFRIEVTPSEAGDSEKWLPQLAKVVALTPEDIARFEGERKATRGFKPIVLKLRVSDAEVAAFAVDRWRFPGVELVSYLNRRYPYGELFAHVLGYVGRIDTKDQETMGRNGVLTHTGKTGLERSYEEQLRGQIGYEQIETNVDGRPIRQVGHVPAKPGADLRLSIDLDLQRAMVTAFGDMDGSAVAVDPRTGEVLGMVSLPSYDSNLFVNGISNVDYKTLNDDPSRPQFNRNVLGGGPPGSTMKPFMALAGLDSGFRRPEDRILSTGEFHIPGQKRGYRDSHGGGHGWVDLRESIAQSVNTYYYKLALDMGIDRVDQYMTRYGFGQKTGIDLLGENIGILPSPAWKAKRNKKEGWYPGETVIAGIGQGYWVVTALQLARGTAAIANGGTLHQLHLVREIRTGYESPWVPKVLQPASRITDNPAHLQAVHEGMEGTIHGSRGTAQMMARGAPYRMAGKTGTAQKVSRKGNVSMNPHSLPFHLRHQALFVGYAPADNPTIAVAVVVEHGGYGGSTAAPIARKIFDAWLLGKMPEPDPAKDKGAPPVAPLAGAAHPAGTPAAGATAAAGSTVAGEEPKLVPVPVNGAWAAAVAVANARVAAQPGHTPQILQRPEMLRPHLPPGSALPEEPASEAPVRSDDALIEPDVDPEDDAVAPPSTGPQR
ncbi:penicillin-binding protein 2 [Lysobacter gummosus]|nr:penicillin-binding protein 2 [Lysobacter gummosus]